MPFPSGAPSNRPASHRRNAESTGHRHEDRPYIYQFLVVGSSFFILPFRCPRFGTILAKGSVGSWRLFIRLPVDSISWEESMRRTILIGAIAAAIGTVLLAGTPARAQLTFYGTRTAFD